MAQQFEIRYIRGHVEVYDGQGQFCFSADTYAEAQGELREMLAA